MLVVTGADGRPLVGLELFTDLREVKRLRRALLSRTSLEGIIGRSGVMQALYDLVEQVAPYDVPVGSFRSNAQELSVRAEAS